MRIGSSALLFYIAVVVSVSLFFLMYSNHSKEALEIKQEIEHRETKPVESVQATGPLPPHRTNNAPVIDVHPESCKTPLFWGNGGGGAGWTVCGDLLPSPSDSTNCVIYSYGLGADWSFDKIASLPPYNCHVHGFDPSDQNWREGMHGSAYSGINYQKQYPLPNMRTFHNWGLGSAPRAVYPKHAVPTEWPGLGDPALSKTNADAWEMRSVHQTMLDLNQTSLSILKVDVEGSEWIAMSSMLSTMGEQLSNGAVKQLLVEWHWDPDSTARNGRNAAILDRVLKLGFVAWKVNRHVGSDCCLDVSYIWTKAKK